MDSHNSFLLSRVDHGEARLHPRKQRAAIRSPSSCHFRIVDPEVLVPEIDYQLQGPRWQDTLEGMWWSVSLVMPQNIDDPTQRRLRNLAAINHTGKLRTVNNSSSEDPHAKDGLRDEPTESLQDALDVVSANHRAVKKNNLEAVR